MSTQVSTTSHLKRKFSICPDSDTSCSFKKFHTEEKKNIITKNKRKWEEIEIKEEEEKERQSKISFIDSSSSKKRTYSQTVEQEEKGDTINKKPSYEINNSPSSISPSSISSLVTQLISACTLLWTNSTTTSIPSIPLLGRNPSQCSYEAYLEQSYYNDKEDEDPDKDFYFPNNIITNSSKIKNSQDLFSYQE